MDGTLVTQVGNEGAQASESDARALEAVASQIEAAADEERAAAEMVRELAADRRKGHSWMHIAEHGSLRSALDRIGKGVQSLRSGAARLRRTTARGLVSEGASTRRIGSLFGVSHQRVSSIVARRPGEGTNGASPGAEESMHGNGAWPEEGLESAGRRVTGCGGDGRGPMR